jgi:GNAT superfamily N-acetyltransferase
MSDLEILAIDPRDQAQLDGWLAVLQDVQDSVCPHLPRVAPAPTVLGVLRHVAHQRVEQWLARQDGRVVGSVEIRMPLKDNLHLAEIELGVATDQRGRGIGAALLAYTEQRVAAAGRTTIITYLVDQIEGGPDRSRDGQRFAGAAGYRPGLDEIHRVADLTAVDDAEQDRLLAGAWRYAGEYELVQWAGAKPDAIVDGAAYLNGRMNLDAPIGELDLEQDAVDAARIRDRERQLDASGRLELGSVLRHRDTGAVAGYTDLVVVPGDEEHCWQGNTIVDPVHRGRRLGTILKVENHRQLRSYRPRMRYVHTWNAEVNAHKIAINEAVGYRAVDRWIAYPSKLPT